jgi:hypothetical protein
LLKFVADLEPKDWLTLVGTVVALIVSTFSLFQKRAESRLTLRKQLSDILSKLSEVNLEIAKARLVEEQSRTPDRTVGYLSDQRRYLVRQAAYLADKLGNEISTYEFLTIAWPFDGSDDTCEAERYFRRATEEQGDAVGHGLALC